MIRINGVILEPSDTIVGFHMSTEEIEGWHLSYKGGRFERFTGKVRNHDTRSAYPVELTASMADFVNGKQS